MFCHIRNYVLLHFDVADTDETLFILENKKYTISMVIFMPYNA